MDSIFFGRQVSKCALVLRSYAKEKIIKVMNMNMNMNTNIQGAEQERTEVEP
jgi:hypothetical protein